MPFIFKLLIVGFLIVCGFVFFFFWRKIRKRQALDNLKTKLLILKFPKKSGEDRENLLKEISLTQQLFSSLSSFKKPVVFEVAVPNIGEEIHFYINIPSDASDPFVSQMHSLWPDLVIEEVSEYNVFNQSGSASVGWVKQNKDFAKSIKTYKESESDTFQSILGALSKTKEVGEGGSVQMVIKPADKSSNKHVSSALKNVKNGKGISSGSSLFSDFFKILSGKGSKEGDENKEKDVDEGLLEAVKKKKETPLFEVNVRLVASAPTKSRADSIFDGLVAGFSQFSSQDRNSFKVVKPPKIKKYIHSFTFREFDKRKKMILNSEELTSIFHFPTSFTEVPQIKTLKSRQLPPPNNLPQKGTLIGENIYRGKRKKTYIKDDDRRRHLYLIGQTGTGKSNLMVNMVHQDIENNKGVAVVDPHGDLIDHILGLIPKRRFDDVIFFNPSDIQNPLGLNMLEYNHEKPEEKTFIVNEMVEIFDKLYDLQKTGGPMFEQYMRNALLLLMEDAPNEPATLMEVPRIFTDSEFRKRKLERIKNPTVIDFWEKQAEKARGEASLSNITPYVTSKFNNFTANDYMRAIVGQAESSFNFRDVMDEGKILLVNLSKGSIGELNANLLGMIIVGKLLISALSRVDMPESERKDFNLFIDEFQNFTTDSISTILSEARKYRLNLTIAHQFIAQLEEGIKDSVFGNVGSLISLRVGAPDAESLIKQFEPFLDESDLVNIDNFHAYVKLLIDGETTDPFNIKTLKAKNPDQKRVQRIKEISAKKYGKQREQVEKDIYKRLRE